VVINESIHWVKCKIVAGEWEEEACGVEWSDEKKRWPGGAPSGFASSAPNWACYMGLLLARGDVKRQPDDSERTSSGRCKAASD
jgi:hypothetical protein